MSGLLIVFGYTVLALVVAVCIAAVIMGHDDDVWPE